MKDKATRRLLSLWETLDESRKAGLLEFAEFLGSRQLAGAEQPVGITAPLCIAPAVDESVVAAMKRLRASYPMIDHAALLSEASHIVEQHVIGGVAKADSISALERLFEKHYAALVQVGTGVNH